MKTQSSLYINPSQQQVLEAIARLGACTDQEVAEKLNWPINRVTPRRHELMRANLVEHAGKTRNPIGRTVNIWKSCLVTR